MTTQNICAMLMAGGQGSRLSVLSELRAKPAVPFAGVYRIIDFSMSNCMHAGIPYIGILTQYRPYSLMEHISMGEAWGYVGRKRVVRLLQPYEGENHFDWYAGTADAIFQNLNFVNRFHGIEHVLILSGDHIYNMNYRELLKFHIENDADLTMSVQEIPLEDTGRFGIVVADDDGRVQGFQEKPKTNPLSNLANLGIYIFKKKVLERRLVEDFHTKESEHDFGHDVLPRMVELGDRVFTHRFEGFWRDVGTIHSLWQTNMDVLDPEESGLDVWGWQVRTNPRSQGIHTQVPMKILSGGHVTHSLVSRGCVLEGDVVNSVLSPGVRVGPGARVERSVIMNDTVIGAGAHVVDAIIDKEARIQDGASIGAGDNTPNETRPDLFNKGISLIGKRAVLPENHQFGRNCLIFPYAKHSDCGDLEQHPSGTTIFNEKYRSINAETFHAPRRVPQTTA